MGSLSDLNNVSSHLKSRFARGFLRALARIHNLSPPPASSSSNQDFALRKCQRVKLAAYASMASAFGKRRVWSRAMLQRIRCHSSSVRRGKVRQHMRTMRRSGKKRKKIGRELAAKAQDVKKLRKLVPGGESMDLEGLLRETAHYVKCLVTQVSL
ncbi:hypothetical protein CRG98_020422 [Punica granatum]|uniref:IBH1-like N-terminal domain-containing protein n=1 Tax=Punica granatum TaxID=22663 RepID=A0A2I0JS67_PUNGR|nr:hypothetical protein CRG98_020422 [Punica granatum]